MYLKVISLICLFQLILLVHESVPSISEDGKGNANNFKRKHGGKQRKKPGDKKEGNTEDRGTDYLTTYETGEGSNENGGLGWKEPHYVLVTVTTEDSDSITTTAAPSLPNSNRPSSVNYETFCKNFFPDMPHHPVYPYYLTADQACEKMVCWYPKENEPKKHRYAFDQNMDGQICGRKGVCKNKKCEGTSPFTKSDLNNICKEVIGGDYADITGYVIGANSSLSCTHIACLVNTQWTLDIRRGDGSSCGKGGLCEGDFCVGEEGVTNPSKPIAPTPSPVTSHPSPINYETFCKNFFPDFRTNPTYPYYLTADQACEKMICWYPKESNDPKKHKYPFDMNMDGQKCGRKGVCKNKKCEGSSPYSKSDLNNICKEVWGGVYADITPYVFGNSSLSCLQIGCLTRSADALDIRRGDGSECGKGGHCEGDLCVGETA